ncbi:DUF4179 domain-containing protein [Niallia sp. 03133]|uniref:DUF4179 domain-containing protein n=1 Tax=Niallia sp. 03133 TaxID=3458060 RepID=UPI004044D70B
MKFEKNDSFHSLNELKVPTSVYKFIEELPNRHISGNLSKEIENQIDLDWKEFNKNIKNKKNRIYIKKLLISAITFAAVITLFIVSTFVSPVMAKVASNIPFINLLFESEQPLQKEITKILDEKGYKWSGVGISIPEKVIDVRINGSEEYFKKVKPKVEETIREVLSSRKYDAYKIQVSLASKEEEEDTNPEERGQTVDPKMRKVTEDISKADPEERWRSIVRTLTVGLTGNKEYKVTGLGYSYKDNKINISIRTSISYLDSEKEIVNAITKMINDYLQSTEVKNTIKEDKLVITVYSKDKKDKKIILEN